MKYPVVAKLKSLGVGNVRGQFFDTFFKRRFCAKEPLY